MPSVRGQDMYFPFIYLMKCYTVLVAKLGFEGETQKEGIVLNYVFSSIAVRLKHCFCVSQWQTKCVVFNTSLVPLKIGDFPVWSSFIQLQLSFAKITTFSGRTLSRDKNVLQFHLIIVYTFKLLVHQNIQNFLLPKFDTGLSRVQTFCSHISYTDLLWREQGFSDKICKNF